jgi:hypothetical protein
MAVQAEEQARANQMAAPQPLSGPAGRVAWLDVRHLSHSSSCDLRKGLKPELSSRSLFEDLNCNRRRSHTPLAKAPPPSEIASTVLLAGWQRPVQSRASNLRHSCGMAGYEGNNAFHDDLGADEDSSLISV